MHEALQKAAQAIVNFDSDECIKAVTQCLASGISAWDVVHEGLSVGMKEVGRLFEKGDYFLAELVMAGDVMKDVMQILEDKFDKSQRGRRGKVILATIKGDVHDLGKNIVGMMLSAAGFEVIDLGTDVDADTIVGSVKRTGAGGIGLTMLLTTAVGSMKEVAEALIEAGIREKVKVAIGGASTNEKLAKDLGFDAYGDSAAKAIDIFEKLLGVS
jgi:5-methyltetrahydrofolate--homocysteine methyltransferase